MTDNIITICNRLMNDFERLGLAPPESIMLRSHEEGRRVLAYIAEYLVYDQNPPRGREIQDGMEEVDVHGIKIRWPTT